LAPGARDGDELSFDPQSRLLTNDTQQKTYEPVPLSVKEDEIRQTGGIYAAGRREFKAAVEAEVPVAEMDKTA
jgi:hypothetical protein